MILDIIHHFSNSDKLQAENIFWHMLPNFDKQNFQGLSQDTNLVDKMINRQQDLQADDTEIKLNTLYL